MQHMWWAWKEQITTKGGIDTKTKKDQESRPKVRWDRIKENRTLFESYPLVPRFQPSSLNFCDNVRYWTMDREED